MRPKRRRANFSLEEVAGAAALTHGFTRLSNVGAMWIDWLSISFIVFGLLVFVPRLFDCLNISNDPDTGSQNRTAAWTMCILFALNLFHFLPWFFGISRTINLYERYPRYEWGLTPNVNQLTEDEGLNLIKFPLLRCKFSEGMQYRLTPALKHNRCSYNIQFARVFFFLEKGITPIIPSEVNRENPKSWVINSTSKTTTTLEARLFNIGCEEAISVSQSIGLIFDKAKKYNISYKVSDIRLGDRKAPPIYGNFTIQATEEY